MTAQSVREPKRGTIRVAIAGPGFMGVEHMRAYNKMPGVEIAAIYSRSGKGRDGDFSHVHGNIGESGLRLDARNVRFVTSYDELLRDPEIDIIDICTPTPTHLELATSALAAGKDVFCEKPLCLSLSEAARLVGALRDHPNRMMQVGHCMPFWPGWSEPRDWALGGQFGKIRTARFYRGGGYPSWSSFFLDGKASGGALRDLGDHDYDYVLGLLGLPQAVTANGSNIVSSDGAYDDVTSVLYYPGGTEVCISTQWSSDPRAPFRMEYEIWFEQATVRFDLHRGMTIDAGENPGIEHPNLLGGDTGWENQLRYFVGCVKTGVPPAVSTVGQAEDTVKVLHLVERAIRAGRRVTWE